MTTIYHRVMQEIPDSGAPYKPIVLCYAGSHSHGTHIPAHENETDPMAVDDVDVLGAVIPAPRHIIGLGKWEHWVTKRDELDITVYSLEKLVRLWLKANPNVLGMLWLRDEDYILRTPVFDLFRAERHIFSSKHAHRSFTGYAHAQLRDIHRGVYEGYMGEKRKALVDQFGYDIKHAAHLIRLLRMGVEFLKLGRLNVFREDADDLLEIKRGKWSLDQVQIHAADLFAMADDWINHTNLPDEPNYERAEELLMIAQRQWIRDKW